MSDEHHPLVSVVMTVYNDGPFVAQAVRSILNQSFTDFEFIIVDDGAIDDSVEQVRQFDDPRIRLIRQENQGLAAALNCGIREARGQFIARQDADDVSLPERLQRQVDLLRSQPAVGLVSCNIHIIDEQGGFLLEKRYASCNDELQQLLIGNRGNPFTHGASMFRKDIAEQVGLYRPAFRRCQDRDLWLRIAEKAELANVPEVLYLWRLRRGSVGAANWGSHSHYSRLALRCAEARRAGKPEPPLTLEQVTRNWFIALTNPFRTVSDPDLAYELILAQARLLQGQRSDARKTFWLAICARPWMLYAWLLYGLSFLPSHTAQRIWGFLRKLYRRGTWRKPESDE